jgi:hypothetical protein
MTGQEKRMTDSKSPLRGTDAKDTGREPPSPDGYAPRLDKGALAIHRLDESLTDTAYWLSRTPEERFAHVEYLRQVNYGDQAGARLQRVLEIVEGPWG